MTKILIAVLLAGCCAAGPATDGCYAAPKFDYACPGLGGQSANTHAWECADDGTPTDESDCYRVGYGSDEFDVAWCCPEGSDAP